MKYLNLFANCQIVKGAVMSVICDLQMRKYYHIPNDMAEIIIFLKENPIEACYEKYGQSNKSVIDSYVNFITKNELGFIDSSIYKELTELDLSWDSYSPITNIIIEYDPSINYEVEFLLDLINLSIDALEVRCYNVVSYEQIDNFLNLFENSTILSIRLIMQYHKDINKRYVEKLIDNHLRVNAVQIHGAPFDDFSTIFDDTVPLQFSKHKINSCHQCGNINSGYFTSSLQLFSESRHHNTCLNRKLSIDRMGFIKNCPSLPENFGHIANAKLNDLLAEPSFKKLWNIKKDDIEICKDCEFRHICTDCRAYVEDPADLYSKPLKCGYNPYTNEWTDWFLDKAKEKGIYHYQLEKLAP